MAPVKILVCGNIDGKFNQVFNRVSSVNKKNGPFEFLLCCGSFFGLNNSEWAAYREGTRRVPIQTYVLGAASRLPRDVHPCPDADELCTDVVALGERGVFTSSGGASVAYLAPPDGGEPSQADVRALEQAVAASGAAGLDLLLTTAWPRGVTRYAATPPGVYSEETGSRLAARLLYSTRPRYVFSGGQALHYERLPYRNHQVLRDQQVHVTRFISLAAAFNVDKHKWLYAFGLEPMVRMARAELVAQPADVTECPFSAEEMATAACGGDGEAVQFFYSTERKSGEPAAKRRRQGPPDGRPTAPCWFCLASPDVEKHLVVNVGETCYLALAKGGLVPGHVLILPVEHTRASTEADDAVFAEILEYKKRLGKLFAAENKAVVFFERNYRQSHLQVQCVPVPKDLVPVLKEAVQDHCDSQDISLDEVPPLSDVRQLAQPGAPYLYVELPGGVKLFHRVGKKLPLSIGRSMLACPPLLNMPERVEWSECVVSKEEQMAKAKEFKTKFKKFA
ncbi:LOW QUALITY PROTEIN: CWF19-like protein 1 [Pollicipes pollicipes]|uniref:LOW QUALITY PROTEIN: CWF19-like protein 1 n=1 Tax=Pollicipes pollicipes TaxID=41117 RepID=UPI001885202E|nr:LOW QUALITY PROTEIN: CWF19-like protein 1 [Pollicipes pollicipes]